MHKMVRLAGGIMTASAALAVPAQAWAQARPSGTQQTQQAMMNDVPHCLRKLGTVSVLNCKISTLSFLNWS